MHRADHYVFTPAETIAAVQALVHRLDTGRWDATTLTPGALNASAAAVGPAFNGFVIGGRFVHVAPAFLRYHPAVYPRPSSQPTR